MIEIKENIFIGPHIVIDRFLASQIVGNLVAVKIIIYLLFRTALRSILN